MNHASPPSVAPIPTVDGPAAARSTASVVSGFSSVAIALFFRGRRGRCWWVYK